MPYTVLTAFLAFTCITAFTPGPNNILALSNSSRLGLRASLPGVAGIGCGMACVMAVCGLLSSSASAASTGYIAVMRYVGCAYIVWLAWKVATAAPPADGEASGNCGFVGGFILQFVNIKIVIYGLTAFSGFILPYYDAPAAILAFALLLALIANAGTLTWALAGGVLKRVLRRHGRIANIVMGVTLLASAVGLLF